MLLFHPFLKILSLLLFLSCCIAYTSKPIRVFSACGFHGREWATSLVCREWERLARYSNHTRWFFAPEVNPWGIHQAKTRDKCSRTNERGVDLNRNLPHVQETRACTLPFSVPLVKSTKNGTETYAGPSPMSERETQTWASYMSNMDPIDIALFVHTGTEAIFTPYDGCWNLLPEPLLSRTLALARAMASKTRLSEDVIGPSLLTLGPNIGTATDYARVFAKVPFAYVIETYASPKKCPPSTDDDQGECEMMFVPHDKHTCSIDLDSYVKRWNGIFEAIEEIASSSSTRSTFLDWAEEARSSSRDSALPISLDELLF